MTRRFLTGVSAVLLVGVTVVLAFDLLPLPKAVAPLDVALFAQPPDGDVTALSLPDNWRSDRDCRPDQAGKYQVTFAAGEDTRTQAVFVPSYTGTLRIRLNGQDLQASGELNSGPKISQGAPLFTVLPDSILHPQDNSLEFFLQPGGR